jgi:hypothetical protein
MGGLSGSLSGGPTWSPANGGGVLCSGAGRVLVGDEPRIKLTATESLLAVYYDGGATTVTGTLCGKVQATWKPNLSVSNGTQQCYFGVDGATTVAYPASSVGGGLDFLHGKVVVLVGTYDGANAKIYVNGASNSGAKTGAISNNTDPFSIGNRGDASDPFGAQILTVGVWAEALSEKQALQLTAHWRVLGAPPPRRLFFDVAAGGTTLTSLVSGKLTRSILLGGLH